MGLYEDAIKRALVKAAALKKSRAHKYIRRIPTGNPKKPWTYVYAEKKKKKKKKKADGAQGSLFQPAQQQALLTPQQHPTPAQPPAAQPKTKRRRKRADGSLKRRQLSMFEKEIQEEVLVDLFNWRPPEDLAPSEEELARQAHKARVEAFKKELSVFTSEGLMSRWIDKEKDYYLESRESEVRRYAAIRALNPTDEELKHIDGHRDKQREYQKLAGQLTEAMMADDAALVAALRYPLSEGREEGDLAARTRGYLDQASKKIWEALEAHVRMLDKWAENLWEQQNLVSSGIFGVTREALADKRLQYAKKYPLGEMPIDSKVRDALDALEKQELLLEGFTPQPEMNVPRKLRPYMHAVKDYIKEQEQEVKKLGPTFEPRGALNVDDLRGLLSSLVNRSLPEDTPANIRNDLTKYLRKRGTNSPIRRHLHFFTPPKGHGGAREKGLSESTRAPLEKVLSSEKFLLPKGYVGRAAESALALLESVITNETMVDGHLLRVEDGAKEERSLHDLQHVAYKMLQEDWPVRKRNAAPRSGAAEKVSIFDLADDLFKKVQLGHDAQRPPELGDWERFNYPRSVYEWTIQNKTGEWKADKKRWQELNEGSQTQRIEDPDWVVKSTVETRKKDLEKLRMVVKYLPVLKDVLETERGFTNHPIKELRENLGDVWEDIKTLRKEHAWVLAAAKKKDALLNPDAENPHPLAKQAREVATQEDIDGLIGEVRALRVKGDLARIIEGKLDHWGSATSSNDTAALCAEFGGEGRFRPLDKDMKLQTVDTSSADLDHLVEHLQGGELLDTPAPNKTFSGYGRVALSGAVRASTHKKREVLRRVSGMARFVYAQERAAATSRKEWPSVFRGQTLPATVVQSLQPGSILPLTGCTACSFDIKVAEHYSSSSWTQQQARKQGWKEPRFGCLFEIERTDDFDESIAGWHEHSYSRSSQGIGSTDEVPAFEIVSGISALEIVSIKLEKGTFKIKAKGVKEG